MDALCSSKKVSFKSYHGNDAFKFVCQDGGKNAKTKAHACRKLQLRNNRKCFYQKYVGSPMYRLAVCHVFNFFDKIAIITDYTASIVNTSF